MHRKKIKYLEPAKFSDIHNKLSILAMVDGKICISSTGAKSICIFYICGANAKQFKDLRRAFVGDEN